MSGPTSVAGSEPGPSRSLRALDSSRWSSASTTGRSTTTRLAAVQRWPVVPNADQRIPSVARSRSASAMTTIPFLPPSSRLSALQAPAGPLGDPPAGRRRARERDDRHVRRVDDRVADIGAGAGHEVDGARREAGLGHQLHERASRSAACRWPA